MNKAAFSSNLHYSVCINEHGAGGVVFRSKLYLAFFLLLAITLVQAGLAIWASGVASYHVERSRVANQMLAEFITLGADKQRLKVWLAQSLLTKDSTVEQRDQYLGQMQQSLADLNTLLQHDQRLSEHPDDFAAISLKPPATADLDCGLKLFVK